MFLKYEGNYYALEEEISNDNDDVDQVRRRAFVTSRWIAYTVLVGLFVSSFLNIVQFYQRLHFVSRTEFAQLTPEIFRDFLDPSHPYSIPDEEWDALPTSPGVITLTDEYVAEKNLPLSQRYPWDANKGLYFLQGHHNLHCLKMIRKSIFEYRHHLLQTQHYMHIDHCLTVLRDDVLCNADDTPRADSTALNRALHQAGTGLGQPRLCKDWKKLDKWADEHTACYQDRYLRGEPILELYMNCPDGSKPWIKSS